MKIEVLEDPERVAQQAASFVAEQARNAVGERGLFVLAVSGGTTPWAMLAALAREELPWQHVHVLQVDERVAPSGDPERNLTHLRESLLSHAPIPESQLHPMPVESQDLDEAARRYGETLARVAGAPAILDLVHLGLGADGHTASLVPGDVALDVRDADVASTGPYQGRRRLTLTFPVLDRARCILWLVTGASKREMLDRLRRGDRTIPAGRVRSDRAIVLADRAAAP